MAAQEAKRPRSTRLDFTPPTAFADTAAELAYYKDECRRLKAIIALQKQKIRKLVTQQNSMA